MGSFGVCVCSPSPHSSDSFLMHVFFNLAPCLCVVGGAGGGRGYMKDIKKEEENTLLFSPPPFACECGNASFSALSHGHKDGGDNPFISLMSCRPREDR